MSGKLNRKTFTEERKTQARAENLRAVLVALSVFILRQTAEKVKQKNTIGGHYQ